MLARIIVNSVHCRTSISHEIIDVRKFVPTFYLLNDKTGARYAGHSKWQNIKKTKETNDQKRCRQFNVIVEALRKAVFTGTSSDPKLNSRLADCINMASRANMPLATVTRVIERFDYLKKNPRRQWLSFKSSDGVIFLVSVCSENLQKSRSTVGSIFRKFGAKSDANGFNAFERKGYIFAKPPEGLPDPFDKAVDDAIEVDAEEVLPEEDAPEIVKFVCDVDNLNRVKGKLSTKNYAIENFEEAFIPKCPVELDEAEQQKLDELMDKLEELEVVERIISNVV